MKNLVCLLICFLFFYPSSNFTINKAQTKMHSINADVVLCDIEGTTTSISFVKDVLFPYAKNNSKSFLQKNWDENTTKQIVADLTALSEFRDFQKEFETSSDISVETIAKFVNYLIDKDLKLGPLKSLQGLVWDQAYADKTIKGHIYKDVPQAFERWKQLGIQICIYSSGSVKAQKLLFGNSEYGDLMPYLSDYFDTAIGNKREAKSYANIVNRLGVSREKVLFLTDIIAEGEAAQESGLQVIILERPGNAPLSEDERMAFIVSDDFDKIEIKKS